MAEVWFIPNFRHFYILDGYVLQKKIRSGVGRSELGGARHLDEYPLEGFYLGVDVAYSATTSKGSSTATSLWNWMVAV